MYELVPHTADVRIRVVNSSLNGLFEDSARALVAFVEPELSPGHTQREIRVESSDGGTLLVDFLNDLLALLHVDRLVFDSFDSLRIEETKLEAVARFSTAHGWREDVKAVTYHESGISREGEDWSARIVLDI